MLPGKSGMEVQKDIKRIDPTLPVVIITAIGALETAVTAIKEGSFDYITKPWNNEKLLVIVGNAIKQRQLMSENLQLRRALKERFGYSNIIGKSEKILKVLDLVTQVAPSRSTVLIQGESGTGKELIAKAIHLKSQRADKAFVPVNSGSMPVDLLESTLFGHVRGAFTSAIAAKKGLFEVADQGTIFFDEIGTISLETQAKLLRVIQEKEFMRLGGIDTIKVDARIIAATNVDLKKLVEEGRFREDLYYRLNVINIQLPPLRERKEDIPPLVEFFTKKYCDENGKPLYRFSSEALKVLMDYHWPGNVRELENVVERAVVLSQDRNHRPRSAAGGNRFAGFEVCDAVVISVKQRTFRCSKSSMRSNAASSSKCSNRPDGARPKLPTISGFRCRRSTRRSNVTESKSKRSATASNCPDLIRLSFASEPAKTRNELSIRRPQIRAFCVPLHRMVDCPHGQACPGRFARSVEKKAQEIGIQLSHIEIVDPTTRNN